MKSLFKPLLVLCLLAMMPFTAQAAETLTLCMTPIPGQTMINEDDPGMALEIAREAATRADIVLDEKFVPWVRAVKMMENAHDAIIIPFSRTPARETQYSWIAKLYALQFGFVSLDTPVNDMNAARTLSRIGVWRGSSMEEELRAEGFKNLVTVSNDDALVEMLIKGRIDAWYGSLNEAAYKFRGIHKINQANLRYGKAVRSQDVWMAARLDFAPKTARKLREALKKMHNDATFDTITARYGLNDLQESE